MQWKTSLMVFVPWKQGILYRNKSMRIGIITWRNVRNWTSEHLVYEWEDVMKMSIPHASFSYVSFCHRAFKSLSWRARHSAWLKKPLWWLASLAGRMPMKGDLVLGFEMRARVYPTWENRRNFIPVIIDFYLTEDELEGFEAAHSRNPLVLVSSMEACAWLRAKARGLKVAHWGLSLSDKYRIRGDERFEKEYDFVLLGRQNKVLRSFMDEYVRRHPGISYVERRGEGFDYYTGSGEYVGCCKDRAAYMALLRKAKIVLYSTPAMDDSREDANGYNDVTPRFLESIACGCHLVLRYPDNADTRYYDLNAFCRSIETYEEFERVVDRYRATPPDMKFYAEYLSRHYTSVRVRELRNILSETYGRSW